MKLNQLIKNKIEENTGLKIKNISTVNGGCISDTYKLILSDDNEYFIKINISSGYFRKEANGLNAINKFNLIRVPIVHLVDDDFLLLENINQASPSKNFFEEFGRKFANLHRCYTESFGFFEDNFIGATVQLNLPNEKEKTNWIEFYWNKRLLFQYKLAEKNGYCDDFLRKLFSKLENKIELILNQSEIKPSLLHGDLWSGNFIADEKGKVCLIDPAVYYGDREADLAMTKLFGGFNERFYSAYFEEFPLNEGWQERENIYKLYHLLNHLNLFGSSYYGSVISAIKSYV